MKVLNFGVDSRFRFKIVMRMTKLHDCCPTKLQRGQSLVELALMLPLILLVLSALLDTGRAVYAYTVMINATREATLLGAAKQLDDAVIQAIATAELARGGIDEQQSQITVDYQDQGFPPRTLISVDIAYDMPVLTAVLPFSSIPLVTHAEMEVFW
jgi:hypothetical protein